MDTESSHRLDVESLAALLQLALGHERHSPDADPAQRIRERLRERLAESRLDLAITPQLSGILDELKRLASPDAWTISQILADPQADLDEIREIKGHAKALARSTASRAELAAGTTIYYAAIAAALTVHGVKITTHSYVALANAFGRLMRKSWMVLELANLFSRAKTACLERKDPKEQEIG